MKRALITLLAGAALVAGAPNFAAAQRGPIPNAFQSINDRQAGLDRRIDEGLRDRSLTPTQAAQLRADFQALVRLEAQYRAGPGGLTPAERDDLNRRFDALSSRIQDNRNDGQRGGRDGRDGRDGRGGRGDSINSRQADLDRRIDTGVRDRSLTPAEAAQLRADFQALVRMETQYRRSPPELTNAERADLDRRFDQLSARTRNDRNDNDRRWSNLDQRQAAFDQRLNRAVRDRRIGQRDADSLRAEFNGIARLEAQYRRSPPGITNPERYDLNARFDRMEAKYRNLVDNIGRPGAQPDNLLEYLLGLAQRP